MPFSGMPTLNLAFSASGRLWVTGKDWARLFEVRLAEQSALGIRSSRHLFDRRCIVR